MNKSESIINISKALVQFQSECPMIEKSCQGYSYKYADLPSIVFTITPILKKHGLAFTQLPSGDAENVTITTVLVHSESGEFFESTISSSVKSNKGNMSEIQAVGSIITYLRRYSLSAMLGIVTDEDVDGHIVRPSINSIVQEINLSTSKEQVREVYERYPDFHNDKTFLGAATKKAEELAIKQQEKLIHDNSSK